VLDRHNSTAVVLTYPGHFLLTFLCLNSIKKHIKGIDKFIVLVDTHSEYTWSGYIDDCIKLYNTPVIDIGKFDFLKQFKHNPWVRQQMIKLNLDLILDNEDVFFVDGDIIFTSDIPYKKTPYTTVDNFDDKQLNYVNRMLGINSKGLSQNNKTICVSGPPFRDLNIQLIKNLKVYLKNKHNKTVCELHNDIIEDSNYSISEWELIEHYKHFISDEKSEYVYVAPYDIKNDVGQINNLYFKTCYCSDTELGNVSWWNSQTNKDFSSIWYKLPITR